MKKATSLLLGFLGMFLMLIIGVFIGRNSISGMVVITEAPIAQVQDNEVSHDVNSTDHNTNSSEIGKININTASMSLLQTLPNIGETLAKRIVDYRNEHGDFTAPEDLLSLADLLDAFADHGAVCVVGPGSLLEKCPDLEISDL